MSDAFITIEDVYKRFAPRVTLTDKIVAKLGAKVDMRPRTIRKLPKKNLKMAPLRKCAQGGCEMRCGMLERCLMTCSGGNCHQICGPESSCSAKLTGGMQ